MRSNGESEVSLIDVLNIFLRQRRLIVGIGIGLAAITAVVLLVKPKAYTSQASFIIQKKDQAAAAGLAAQLGMDLPTSDPNQSPAFYAALVKTPDVLEQLLDTTFRTSTNSKPQSLAVIWNFSDKSPQNQRQAVLDKLEKVISSDASAKLDLVTVKVVTRDAVLSKELADAVVGQVNWFNLRTRQSRAAAERQFDERLVSDVGAQLRRAEDEAQSFLQENQQARMSAALEMQKQRLTRQLDILNARYITLVTAYDRARMDEVRDTPVITLIEKPRLPIKPDSRGLIKKTILSFLLGIGLGLVLSILRQAFRTTRSSAGMDAREFQQLLAETSKDVRRLWVGRRSHRTAKSGSPAELS